MIYDKHNIIGVVFITDKGKDGEMYEVGPSDKEYARGDGGENSIHLIGRKSNSSSSNPYPANIVVNQLNEGKWYEVENARKPTIVNDYQLY